MLITIEERIIKTRSKRKNFFNITFINNTSPKIIDEYKSNTFLQNIVLKASFLKKSASNKPNR